MRLWPLVFVAGTACSKLLGFEPVAELAGDASPDSTPGFCAAMSTTCATTDVLRVCTEVGGLPQDTACSWGCRETGGAHCAELVPTGGALTSADLAPDAALADLAITNPTLINSSTGEIIGLMGPIRPDGEGVIAGIDFEVRGGVGVFRVATLAIDDVLVVAGTNAIAIVSLGPITFDQVIDARAHDNIGTTCPAGLASPGGFVGGNVAIDGSGTGGGRAGDSATGGASGGGGGGHGGAGGRGGDGGNSRIGGTGGAATGANEIAILAGAGGGGGGGGGGTSGRGGSGGGAIQLVTNASIRVQSMGGVNAGGCRGLKGDTQSGGGGGGGAGGAILLETPVLEIGLGGAMVGFSVNGGGGGAGGATGATNGTNSVHSSTPATGGTGDDPGGDGGAGTVLGGGDGADSITNGGGGGGAVGRIRILTRTGSLDIGAMGFISPSTSAMPTSSSVGTATVN